MNQEILNKSLNKALNGGMAGSAAMATQVLSLMWLRTTMNYQYRYGSSTLNALKTLYSQGGIPRFYRGLLPALVQGPLSRFGDTAANSGMMYYLNNNNYTKDLNVATKSFFCSTSAALWRIIIMPVDSIKTNMQVNGKDGLNILSQKLKTGGAPVLYNGAIAASSATFVGHFPWFFTYNYLNQKLPNYDDQILLKFIRNGAIGFSSSVVSDTCSNSLRVIKTTKQTHNNNISYTQAVNIIVKKDGINGLFFRGLQTRILANGLQSSLFTITWKYFEKKLNQNP
jgi:hypothetical protein